MNAKIILPDQIINAPVTEVGKKAANLSVLAQHGFKIPRGFSITPQAYDEFVQQHKIQTIIADEFERKKFSAMRWEEMWDAAFRIRHAFVTHDISPEFKAEIIATIKALNLNYPLAVRSASTREDSEQFSFAGLHSTIVNVANEEKLFNAIIKVWASLWSDNVLLYQHVLKQDPDANHMAILIQEMAKGRVSGITFTADPNDPENRDITIEAVAGHCSELVSGSKSPQSLIVSRQGEIKHVGSEKKSLLQDKAIEFIAKAALKIEKTLNYPVDIEWTFADKVFTVLQARKITTASSEKDDKQRRYFLALTPNRHRLKKLRKNVAERLIPKLKATGDKMAQEKLEDLDDRALSNAIVNRYNRLQQWRVVYRNQFVPFAHGVRNLGVFYNDMVKPDDPYEFVHILDDEKRISVVRNQALQHIIDVVQEQQIIPELKQLVAANVGWDDMSVEATHKTQTVIEQLNTFRKHYLETSYLSENLDMQPQLLLKIIINYCEHQQNLIPAEKQAAYYEEKLLTAVSTQYQNTAREYIELARLSWRLRDDDDLLLGRLTNYTLKGIALGVKRLQETGRLKHDPPITEPLVYNLTKALRDPEYDCTKLGLEEAKPQKKYRQGVYTIKGQPACPGIVTGPARCIKKLDDLSQVKAGEVIICDGVDPGMTMVMPLCAGIVEMRGGMLIHGVIIAREFGLPCVTGANNALHIAKNGDIVTVDGDTGKITIKHVV